MVWDELLNGAARVVGTVVGGTAGVVVGVSEFADAVGAGLSGSQPAARPAEGEPGLPEGALAEWQPEAQRDDVLRDAALAGLHVAGLGYTAVARAVRFPPVVGLAASAVGALDAAPQAHALVATVIGKPLADTAFGAAGALTNALSNRPLGLLADAGHRWVLVQEDLARRAAWADWAPAFEDAAVALPDLGPAQPRPVPLPPGAAERVAAWSIGTGAGVALAALLATRSLSAVAASLAAGVPKAADRGRDAFAAWFDRETTRHDCLVVEPAALRRLDRADTVVLDVDVLLTGRAIARRAGRTEGDVAERIDPFAESLLAAGAAAGQVLVADDALADRFGATPVPGADDLPDAIRDLQRDGHVVVLVSAGNQAALAAADVGIGVRRDSRPLPRTADVLVRTCVGAWRMLDAIPMARRLGSHSAWLAVAGSGFGALLALLGPRPGAANRASLPVHAAALVAIVYGTWSAAVLGRLPGPVPVDRTPWHAMSRAAVLEALGSSRSGLDGDEVAERLEAIRAHRAGPAEIGLVRASVEELATPLTPALAVGAGVSASTGSLVDPVLIGIVLGLTALIGGAQRVSAQRAMRALRRTSAAPVRVRRGGHTLDTTADELVPGDIVILQAGQTVPADCRLLTKHGLELDESTLTGESALVVKSTKATGARLLADRTSMVYEGTAVAAGQGEAVVVATGQQTEAGRALRLQDRPPPTGVELRLRKLTARVLPFSIGAGVVLVVSDLLHRRPTAVALGRAVSLAVAAVPEGLPFVATMAELAAARRLSGRGALVRNPSTIEALGRTTVLCFDKTGTLTEGRIALRHVSDGVDTRPVTGPVPEALQAVVAAAMRASPFQLDSNEVTHQTDRAVLRGAQALGLPPAFGHSELEHVHDLPFESSRGYHATLWHGATSTHVSVKGAPEVVLPLCDRWRRPGGAEPLDPFARSRIDAEVHRLARQGHRVLAVAENRLTERVKLTDDDVAGLEFRGLVALVDPVRPTAAAAVATLREAGVEVMMITGDHPSTAKAIAAELDAVNGKGVLSGTELDELTDEQLTKVLPDTAVFARVTPAQKARIVAALQRGGAAVAVTGDGTNDAPAIRLADVGIALGTRATPAAREAADVVVTDDRIETITDAIVEGRAMWSSVRDALSILLGGNLGEIIYTLGTGLVGTTGGLNARQLLLINLLTDVLPAMAVAVRPPAAREAEQLLAEGPEGSLGASLDRDIAVRAATTAGAAGAAWALARPVSTPAQASTVGMVALVGAQLGQTMAVRGRTPLVIAAGAGSMLVLGAAVQVPVLSHLVGCRPLLPHQWAIALGASAGATAAELAAQRLLERRPPAATGAS